MDDLLSLAAYLLPEADKAPKARCSTPSPPVSTDTSWAKTNNNQRKVASARQRHTTTPTSPDHQLANGRWLFIYLFSLITPKQHIQITTWKLGQHRAPPRRIRPDQASMITESTYTSVYWHLNINTSTTSRRVFHSVSSAPAVSAQHRQPNR